MGTTQALQPPPEVPISHNPQTNLALLYLMKTQATVAHFINGQQEEVQFTVKCPRCQTMQFDDQLGRRTNCYQCQLVYFVSDGIVNVCQELTLEERRVGPLTKSPSNLTSVVIYVNQATLCPELRLEDGIDYRKIVNNVVLPFFSIRQRVVESGITFKIGTFEFRVIGASPQQQGIIGRNTEIYCYETYQDAPIKSIKVMSNRRSTLVEHELKNQMIQFPNLNQVIRDTFIGSSQLLVLSTDRPSGKLSNMTKVECIPEVPKIKSVKFCCLRMPPEFRRLNVHAENSKHAVLKTVIVPYFTALTRYIERGQMVIISDFEFTVYFQEEQGLVIPFHTTLELEFAQQEQQQTMPLSVVRRSHLRSDQQLNHLRFQRYHGQELSRQHVQQIEALHRLLNTFILLNENPQLFQQSNGASKESINRLPIREIDLDFIKSKGLHDEDHSRCMICLSDYEHKEVIRTMPCCNYIFILVHYFHQDCIDNWLTKNKTCPICKTSCDQD